MGSFIRIGPGIEEDEPSLCGGAPWAVIPGGILKCRDPACVHASQNLPLSIVQTFFYERLVFHVLNLVLNLVYYL